MVTKRQKFQKIKDRERRVHKKILARREAVRKQKKEELAKENMFEKEYNERIAPKPKKDEDVMEQIQKNLEILEGLEKEYQAEIEARKEAGELLEAEGAKTLKEKAELLQQAAIIAGEGISHAKKIKGSAKCSFKVVEE